MKLIRRSRRSGIMKGLLKSTNYKGRITTKQFKGLRPIDKICDIARSKGYVVDKQKFEQGSDFITFRGERTIIYNTFNGQFMVYDTLTCSHLLATHESLNLDNEQWYSDILNMFYEGEISTSK